MYVWVGIGFRVYVWMDKYIVFIVYYSVYVFMDRYMHAYIHEAAQLPPAPTILLACWFSMLV